ncbi:MAG: CHASE domain-containing protein, partial [Acidimicrobiales bacterium]
MGKRSSIRTRLRQIVLLPLAVLIVGLLASLFAAGRAKEVVAGDAQSEADYAASTVEFLTQARVNTYTDVLLTLRSFYSGSENVDRGEFNAFVDSTQVLDRYPGIQSLQYLSMVPLEDLTDYERAVRDDTSLSELGNPQFSVESRFSERESYVIDFVEPMTSNEYLMGTDLGSSEEFRTYIERARDTGGLVASAPFESVPGAPRGIEAEDPASGTRFYLMLAVYDGSEIPTVTAERRKLFRGVVAGIFEPSTMLTSALRHLPVAVELIDGSSQADSENRGLVYEGVAHEALGSQDRSLTEFDSADVLQAQLTVGDRWWDLRVEPLPGLASTAASGLPVAVLILGLVVTLLLSALVLAVVNSRYHAQLIAKEMTKSLRASEARALGIVRNAGDAIVSVQQDGAVASFNSAAVHMLQWSAEEIVGKPVVKLMAAEHIDVHETFQHALKDQADPTDWSTALDIEAKRRDGTTFAAHLTVGIVGDPGDYSAIWILRDISAQVELQERLSYQARHDALTGLENRASIQQRISDALSRSQRGETGMAVLFLDLDHFKNVNDSMGHEMGDKLLVEVVGRMQTILRDTDVLGRVGGDE